MTVSDVTVRVYGCKFVTVTEPGLALVVVVVVVVVVVLVPLVVMVVVAVERHVLVVYRWLGGVFCVGGWGLYFVLVARREKAREATATTTEASPCSAS